MKITLPTKENATDPILLDTKILVVIGANGAGKSSFGRDLAEKYKGQAKQISGIHALFLSNSESNLPSSSEHTRFKSLLKKRLTMPYLTEYEQLILRLQSEEFEAAVNFKEAAKSDTEKKPPITKLDIIQSIWERMFPHNKLIRKSGFFELASVGRDSNAYEAGNMSDSEKLVFYWLGAALCAGPNALLIIEEPGTLLHTSIKNQLWNEIEAIRPDCTFVYLTHDIDFATSRSDSKLVWIRSYDADNSKWDYEILESNESFPEEVYMEILGSRKPILFIEGTDSNSIDSKLYPLIFPDYLVKPMGGCQKVIETTKAFGDLKDFHMLSSKGIVDRDRRTQGEIDYLRSQHIYVPEVAEVENLLMLEDVIKTVAKRLMKDPEAVFAQVKNNVLQLFQKDLDAQVIMHAKHLVRKKLETTMDKKITTVEQLAEHVENIRTNIDVDKIYTDIKNEFEHYVETHDYKSILRIYNQKGMLPQCRLCSICGISNKESYLNLILSILKENKEDAETIRTAIKKALGT